MSRLGIVLIVIVFIALTWAGARSSLYVIRDGHHDTELVWNEREALLFIGASRIGWSTTYGGLALERLRAFGGALTPPSQRHTWVTVVRYADGAIKTQVLDGRLVGPLTVVDGKIYDGAKWRWSGNAFEPIDDIEAERFYKLIQGYDRYHPGGGWGFVPTVLDRNERVSRFPMIVGGRTLECIVHRSRTSESISFQLPDGTVTEVWSLDERPKHVSQQEYERQFTNSHEQQ